MDVRKDVTAMDKALALSWSAYLATLLVVLGVGLAASGLRAAWTGRRQSRCGPEDALVYRYLFAFRQLVVGLALAGAGVGWAWPAPWLCAAALCVGAGELLESSSYIWVLRRSRRAVAPVDLVAPAAFRACLSNPGNKQ
jgi:hypothetical protein